MGTRDLIGEILGIFGDVNLHSQGEEYGRNHLKALEGGVLPFFEHPEEGVHISMGGGLEGGEVVILNFLMALGSARGSRRELPVTES
jgi:hypothetical protein